MNYKITSAEKILWLSKLISSTIDDYGNDVDTYSVPVKYKANYQPVSADSSIQEFGANSTEIIVALFDKNQFTGVFNDFDLVYLDGASPSNETNYGDNSNYRVQSVREQNKKIIVYFEKLTKRK